MTIREGRDGALLELAFDRTDKRNALTGAMYDALTGALARAAADDGVRVVLFRGEGGHFTGGNDLGDFLSSGLGAQPALRFIDALARFEKPMVAAVEGFAVGIGTTLLLHCDLVYAGATARFILPFVDLGLVPEAGSSRLLAERIGAQAAAAMLMLGEPLDAPRAAALGLAELVADGDLHAHARAKAQALAAKPPRALATTRRLMRGDRGPLEAQIAAEAEAFAAALAGDEAQGALQRFFARR